jgi:glycerol-3-phosphate dehydrogenase subunit B
MKFDTIIIGGGLSGMTCAIAQAQKGKRVAVIAAGQSNLHFHSGSFDLLGYQQGQPVSDPVTAIAALPESHPYHRLGDVEHLATQARQLLADAGVGTQGDAHHNHFRLSPIGKLVPTWLTMEDMFAVDSAEELKGKKIGLVNIVGFLDFAVPYLADALHDMGAEVTVRSFTTPLLENARRSPSEMRATNIAKYLDDDSHVKEVADRLNSITPRDCDLLLLPAILGIANDRAVKVLKENVKTPLRFVATIPPSVPGTRIQSLLRRRFQQLGGTLLPNDTVKGGGFENNHLKYVCTENLADTRLEANEFVLATGSFLGGGLSSDYYSVRESVFGLDVELNGAASHVDWTTDKLFDKQPYESFGVKADNQFRVSKDGTTIDNLYAIGSVLSGNDPQHLADATGVDLLTALAVL